MVRLLIAGLSIICILTGCGNQAPNEKGKAGGSSSGKQAATEKKTPSARKKSVAELATPPQHEVVEVKLPKEEWDAFFANGAPGAFVEYSDGTVIGRAEMIDWTDGGVVVITKRRFTDGREMPSNLKVKRAAKYVATTEPVEQPVRRNPFMTLFVISNDKPEVKRLPESRTFTIGGAEVIADEKVELFFKSKANSVHWMSKDVPFGGLVRWESANGTVQQEVVAFGKGKRD